MAECVSHSRASEIIANLLSLLAKLPPDILAGLASTVGGAVTGGVATLAVTSLTATAPAVAVGGGAYALGAGATAVALKGGIAIDIGSGASAAAIGGVSVAIAPIVAAGLGVGALIGFLSYLVWKYVTTSIKGKKD